MKKWALVTICCVISASLTVMAIKTIQTTGDVFTIINLGVLAIAFGGLAWSLAMDGATG